MKIKKITKLNNSFERYDIQTKNHNFLANGILVHNSLIKVVRLGKDLLISTNGAIDAFKAPIQEQIGCTGKTFGGLFMDALLAAKKESECGKACFDWVVTPTQWLASKIEEGYTYMFELTSPYSKIVVPWKETRAFFIGCRDNRTFEETRFFEHRLAKLFSTPEVFQMRNLQECVSAAEKLDCNHEGFVVCDANFHRLKVKSTVYVSLHHMHNNGSLSFERGIDIVKSNELDEVLTYFPEFSGHLLKIKEDFDNMVSKLKSAWKMFCDNRERLATRKDQALFIMSDDCFGKYSGAGFALVDGKVSSVDEWIETIPSAKLVKFLGYKE